MNEEEKEKLKKSYEILRKAVDAYYKEHDIEKALELIESALKVSHRAIFAYQFKSDILRGENKIDEALVVLEQGLKIDNFNYFLFWKRAEILGFFKNRLPEALTDIQNAINYFEITSSNQDKQLSSIGDDKQRSDFLKNYTSNKIDLKMAQLSLLQLNSVTMIASNVQQMQIDLSARINKNEDYIKQERFRNIELLGIFTAVLGFIFANVQRVSIIKSNAELIYFDIALAIPLLLFLLIIHKIFKN